MNLKEAIELIDPEIKEELKCRDKFQCGYGCGFKLQGRLSQMKREVEFLKSEYFFDMDFDKFTKRAKIIIRIEALNILIKHLEEVLK